MNDAIGALARFVDGAAGHAEARGALCALRLDSQLTKAAFMAGVVPAALDDFLERGRRAFADGSPGFEPGDPTRELTPESWARGLRAVAPHLFGRR